MKLLLLTLSLLGCNDVSAVFNDEPQYKLADPNCKPYVAIPGEPCRDGLYLDVPFRPRGTALATCQCYAALVEQKR
jgi:hypothetical protein